MRKYRGFTLIELLVVIAVIAILMAVLMPALHRAREGGKRVTCLNNLKQLALAWNLYADENGDRIVNGATGFSNQSTAWGDHRNELSWIDGFHPEPTQTELQIEDIRRGALFPYTKNVALYKCPTGKRGYALTYAIMFSMNAVNHPASNGGAQGVKGAHVKKRTEIRPNLAQRLVFIDEGFMTSDAYAVYYNQETWWDDPPVRHGDGATVSYADGHSEYWKWKGVDTIKRARSQADIHTSNWTPESNDGYTDLYDMQRGCWGKLGYNPSR